MKKIIQPAGLLAALLLGGCISFGGDKPTAPATPQANTQTPPPAQQAADPFKGTYNGVLPCADCDGLQTSLTLDGAGNYTIQSIKLGKKENRNARGVYRYTTDKKHLQLDNNASNLTFMVGEGFLEVRLPDGSKGERPLADENYRLKRQ